MGSRNRIRLALVLLVLLITLGAFSLYGQTLKGTILGTITDSSGAVVPATSVVVTETGTNTSRTGTTNESGLYVFANLDPGVYRVEIEHPGFRKVSRANIDLPPNNTIRIDVELIPGAVSEVVDVTAEAPILKTDRADSGGQLETQQLQTLPIGANRNYQGLLSTIPGVAHPVRTRSEFFNSQDSLTNRVNGQHQSNNNYQIEGIDNNVEQADLSGIIPPIEAIQTVDVSTTNYDPELGRAGGAVANVTLRSGTNQIHGSLFEYHKNENIAATDVFATSKAPTTYNQFGGTVGGPIRKDKLFFFLDYQGSRDHKGVSNLVDIPTAQFRVGDFSGAPTTIYDPSTGNANGTGRTAFLNNQIPDNRISPITRRLLAFLPATTRAGFITNFELPTVRVKTLDQGDSKIDYVLSANDRIMGRYSIQQAQVADPGLYGPNNGIYGGAHAGGFEGYGPARTQSLGLNYSRVWSPTLVMEVRSGVLRNKNIARPWDFGTTLAQDVGIKGANLDEWSSGLSGINVNGFQTPLLGTRGDIPWDRANTNISLVTNWTKTFHNHVIKWGYDLRRYRNDIQQTTAGPRGLFTFGNGPTALNGNSNVGFSNAFASFLLDMPTQIDRARPTIFPARRDWLHSLYVQDKWQFSSKLTLDLGLRWEYFPSSRPAFPGGFANYNWTNNTIELAGLGNIPMNLGVESQKKSFAPRVGVAYRLNNKTVVRVGYGMSYLPRNFSNFSFPVRQQNTYSPPNSFSAAGSMGVGIPAPDLVTFPTTGILPAPPTASESVTKKDLYHSYVQSFNFSVQRALPGNFVLEGAFVGNHTVNLLTDWNYNIGTIGGGAASQPFNQLYGRTAAVNIGIGTNQNYNALQAKLDRRFSHGLAVTTSYTYSKALDYGGQGNTLRQFLNLALEKGRSDTDITHVFVQTYIYELPFGNNKRWAKSGVSRAVLGGWQLNGIFTSQTGPPLKLSYSATSLNAPGYSNQPNLVGTGKPQIFGNVGPGQLWFDTSRFAAPPALTIGNVGRNILTGPGLVNLDLSIFRKFRIREGMTLEVRGESFNFSNTPHFDKPGTTLGNANFGQVTASNDFTDSTQDTDNRKVQIGIRLFF